MIARGRLSLWLAQGFGVGRIPVAPGTFGSVVGLAWFALLLTVPNGLLFAGGILGGIVLSIAVGGPAERLLGAKDPGSVVLDEIVAMPVCFLSWIAILFWERGVWPSVESFFGRSSWIETAGVFLAFRFFDIVKPWPVRQSQSWPGGWGITVDDLMAAAYVNLCVLAVFCVKLVAGSKGLFSLEDRLGNGPL